MKKTTIQSFLLVLLCSLCTSAYPKEGDDVDKLLQAISPNEKSYNLIKETRRKYDIKASLNSETFLCSYIEQNNKKRTLKKYSFRRNPKNLLEFTDGLYKRMPEDYDGYPLYGNKEWKLLKEDRDILVLSKNTYSSGQYTESEFNYTDTVSIYKKDNSSSWLHFNHLGNPKDMETSPTFPDSYSAISFFIVGKCDVKRNIEIDYNFEALGYKGFGDEGLY